MPQNEPIGNKLLMVGGKGGVGKTTCSAAIGVHFASAGQKTLLISSANFIDCLGVIH
ncbi:MAG: AAA family ATPase [Deltaproteobacteria bacterium]|nr:AAA family ATPase [Deltaproteobacteria bacterium]